MSGKEPVRTITRRFVQTRTEPCGCVYKTYGGILEEAVFCQTHGRLTFLMLGVGREGERENAPAR